MDRKKISVIVPYAVALVAMAAAGAATYKNTHSQQEIQRLNASVESQKKMIDAQNEALAGFQKSIEAHQKIIKDVAAQRDKLILEPAAPAPTPLQEARIAQNEAVEEALEPREVAKNDFDTKMDALKKNYEEILVSYFLLKKCNIATDTQYHVITSALSQEMASLDAPGRMQYDILTSAEGSYRELYSNTPCTDESIGPLKGQFDNFVNNISKNFTPEAGVKQPEPPAADEAASPY